MRGSVLVGYRKNADAQYSDFKLIALLGRGTFGKVFLAEYTVDKKQYAIKVIRKDVLIEYN
jgi:serine/threonine protein kinase